MNKVSNIEVVRNNSGYRQGREESEFIEDDFEVTDWPTLDDKALIGLAGDFVDLATKNSEADPAAVLLTFLGRFGIECGPLPYLMVGDTKHHTRIFGVIVGATSKARKGTSGKPVQRLFDLNAAIHAHPELSRIEYQTARESPGPLSSGEGIIYHVRDGSPDGNSKKGEEVSSDSGVKDKRLFILDEEFAGVLTCTKREGNTLSTILRCAWDTGTLEPLTKTSRIKATGAHVGIISHITIPELHQKLHDVETFNGFSNRILWCCARRSKLVPFPEPMPTDRLKALQERLLDIISKARCCDWMRLDGYAREKWEEVYPDLTADKGGLLGAVTNRAEAQALRLSMIYALLDGKENIGVEHLEAALAFCGYCTDSARFIFSSRESDPHAERILQALKDGTKSKTDLHKVFSGKAKGADIQRAINELVAAGKIKVEKEETGGKPRTILRLVDDNSGRPKGDRNTP